MRIVPDSTITLYGGVDIDNGEQLVFKSRANQTAYFQSKLVRAQTPCTVVRKTGRLRVEIAGSVIATCNYLSFVNPSFDNKIVYARIIDYDYINNECVEISYAIDYWQTWMFDVHFDDMYIEREQLSEGDYQKSVTNPYDTSILELKTLESLPVSTDMEKPYYDYGLGNAHDGIYCAATLASEHNITNGFGILISLSDPNLENLDDSAEAGSTAPSAEFADILDAIQTLGHGNYGTSFYKLSRSVYDYLAANYSTITAPIFVGDDWTSSGLGILSPMDGSVNAPVSYLFIASGASTVPADTGNLGPVHYVSKLMNWLTKTNLTGNIIGLYAVPNPMILFSGDAAVDNAPINVKHTTAKTQNVANKKLDRYPYSYYRVITPNGDIKELHMEDFKTAQDGIDECRLGITMDIVEKPNLIVAPLNYKASGASPRNATANMNVREGMIFTQFPTMPYNIDGFVAQIAAVSNSIIGNNTLDYGYEIQQKQLDNYSQWKDVGKGILDAVTDIPISGPTLGQIGALGRAVGKGIDVAFSAMQADLTSQRNQNEFDQSQDAYKALANTTDNAVYNNFQYTKPAYAANQYHQINGDGIVNYNLNNFMDVLFVKVSLHPQILANYDKYFTNYGYASGRCGIPRVIEYVHGETDTDKVPHWMLVNNKPATYIKTIDCKVTHSMLPVATFIKTMFDSGVRMIQGDANG